MNKIFLRILFLLITIQIFSTEIKHSNTSLDDSKKYQTDYFFKGKELNFNGEAEDVYFSGDTLNFNGKAVSHLNAIGKNIIINGIVEDNLTIIAREVQIKGTVNGTIIIFSKDIIIDKNSKINGTVFVLGKFIKVFSPINNDIYIAGGEINIDAVINGNAQLGAGRIILSENAKINGDLKYYSDSELKNLDKDKITGTIQFSKLKNLKFDKWNYDNKKFQKAMFGIMNIFKLGLLLSMLIGGLLLLIFPAMKTIEKERTNKNFWMSLPWGLITILIYIALNLFLIIIPPLAFILFLAVFPLIFVSQIFGITMTGQYLFKLFKWKISNRFIYLAFGFIFYGVLQFIPVFCMLSTIFFSSLGWGFIIQRLFKKEF